MRRLEIEVDGRKELIWAERLEGDLWLHWRGRTLVISGEGPAKKSRGGGGGGKNPGEVKAPMPGKVTQVGVSVGGEVNVGDSLVVMEAMKMEYSLVAEAAGKVKAVQCRVGESVAMGQILVVLEVKE